VKRKQCICLDGGDLKLLLAGLLVGVCGTVVWQRASSPQAEGIGGILERAMHLKEAAAELDQGEYEFFANRRSVWVVNRTNGRMANYLFRDDDLQTVERSRIATIDLNAFPRKDTVFHLSDRNLNNILWVCNVRTGDVQMWHPTRDGVLRPAGPIATSTDLMEREQQAPR
jgi:hypothetical protein